MSGSPDDQAAHPAVPARIGRYEVKSVLGTGNFGRVVLAFDPAANRQVAIKQPHGEGLQPKFLTDFLKEAKAAAQIDHHPNVCPVYDVGSDGDGLPYIVMRFVPGGTLKGLLEKHRSPLPVRTAAVIARKLALGLSAAHEQKVIHRDLKPANVLYDATNKQVLITDFGLARVAPPAHAGASISGGCGTPYYMPPEQWGSKAFGGITPLSDVYSLGIILYEMLAGQRPFAGTPLQLMTLHCAEAPHPPSLLRSAVDRQIEALCLRALAKHQTERYRSAQAFADALAAYLNSGEPSKPKPDSGSSPKPGTAEGPDGDEIILEDVDPLPKTSRHRPVGPRPSPPEPPDEAITTASGRASPTEPDFTVEPTPARRRPRRGPWPWPWVALGFLFLVALTVVLALLADRWRSGKSTPTRPARIERLRGNDGARAAGKNAVPLPEMSCRNRPANWSSYSPDTGNST